MGHSVQVEVSMGGLSKRGLSYIPCNPITLDKPMLSLSTSHQAEGGLNRTFAEALQQWLGVKGE